MSLWELEIERVGRGSPFMNTDVFTCKKSLACPNRSLIVSSYCRHELQESLDQQCLVSQLGSLSERADADRDLFASRWWSTFPW